MGGQFIRRCKICTYGFKRDREINLLAIKRDGKTIVEKVRFRLTLLRVRKEKLFKLEY